jgi:hypothetical protein
VILPLPLDRCLKHPQSSQTSCSRAGHQVIDLEDEVRGVGSDGALDGKGMGEGLEELVESRGPCGGSGAGGADPGIRRLCSLAPWAAPDQLSGPAVQGHAEELQHGGGEAVLPALVVLQCLAGDDPVPPSLGAAVGGILNRLNNR